MTATDEVPGRGLYGVFPPGRAARRVLLVLLAGVPELGGYTVCRAAQAGPETFYPLIARMERQGWVTPSQEAVPYGQDRPPRRFYTMTGKGRELAAAVLRLALPFGDPELSSVTAPAPVPYEMGRADRRILLALLPGPANATFGVLHWLAGVRWYSAAWFTAGLDRLEDHGWIIPVPGAGPLPCYWLAPGHRAAVLGQLKIREAS